MLIDVDLTLNQVLSPCDALIICPVILHHLTYFENPRSKVSCYSCKNRSKSVITDEIFVFTFFIFEAFMGGRWSSWPKISIDY